ncbi:MAG: hypothetical protein Q9200_006728, partial [Gallowayella weberi]
WLQFSDTRELAITDTKRLSRLLTDLDDPSVQRPSIAFFVGLKAKDIALRELFPWNNIRKGRRDGIASLRAETLSLPSSNSIFFAESDPLGENAVQPDTAYCHEVSSSTLEWADFKESKELSDIVHSRLLFLFVNVLCIFADDFPDFLDVVNLLQKWASMGRNSCTLSLPQLRVIIVRRGRAAGPSPTFDLLETEDVRFNLQRPEIIQYYSSVTVLYLADEQISPLARYQRLKELLQRQLDEAVHFRQACGTLFSALHLASFFSKAVQYFATTVSRPFDYLLSTRPNESFDWAYREHLGSFLRLGSASKAPCDAMTRRRSRFGCCRYIRRLLKCWLTDGYYNVDAVEAAMKASFGPLERMFGTSQSPYGTKVAVTATSISDASPVLFSNYNGLTTRAKDCGHNLSVRSGYKHLRPPDVRDEPFLWEALFKPAKIGPAGTFQDGGLKHNNPINLALWEIPYIWPSIQRPDIVVSLGTGTGSDSQSPHAPNFRHVIQDGFIPRLWRSFMSSLDGQSTWRDLWNRLDERSRDNYSRFNVSLSGDGPAMDDIQRIDQLRACVQSQPDSGRSQLKTAFALLISTFFFELSSAPTFQAGRYFCEGTIRCRLTGRTICQTLQRIHQSNLTFMTSDQVLGQLEPEDDLCSGCSRYLKKVHFVIRHPTEQTTVFVQSTTLGRRNLSSFPQSMQWFIDQQHLAEPFGVLMDYNTSEPCQQCLLLVSTDDLVKRRPFSHMAGRKRRRLR